MRREEIKKKNMAKTSEASKQNIKNDAKGLLNSVKKFLIELFEANLNNIFSFLNLEKFKDL